jgi:hypothetical protein
VGKTGNNWEKPQRKKKMQFLLFISTDKHSTSENDQTL